MGGGQWGGVDMERGEYGKEVVAVVEEFVEEAPDRRQGEEEDAEKDGEWRGAIILWGQRVSGRKVRGAGASW